MPNITLSIRENDMSLWEYARRYADNNHTTLSGLATKAMANYLSKNPDKPLGPFARSEFTDITLPVRDEASTAMKRVTFSGRWLAEPPTTDSKPTSHTHIGIAKTANEHVAVWRHEPGKFPVLNVYPTFQDARAAHAGLGTSEPWKQAELVLDPPERLDI